MTKRRKYGWALAAAILFFNPPLVGLLFGVLPCYVLPEFGGVRWCGYKSEPPHFGAQFTVGALLSLAVTVTLAWRWARLGRRPNG